MAARALAFKAGARENHQLSTAIGAQHLLPVKAFKFD
jgi:hypothetical protein